jgi:hypothetical protein
MGCPMKYIPKGCPWQKMENDIWKMKRYSTTCNPDFF